MRKKGDPLIRHGMYGSGVHKSWSEMMERCYTKSNSNYPHYGGRGITVSDSWKVFENFFVDMGERPVGMSLGRIDNDRGYSKENCRWETKLQQNGNKRNILYLEFNGQRKPISDWAREVGLPKGCLEQRIALGWSVERSLLTKKRRKSVSDRHPKSTS